MGAFMGFFSQKEDLTVYHPNSNGFFLRSHSGTAANEYCEVSQFKIFGNTTMDLLHTPIIVFKLLQSPWNTMIDSTEVCKELRKQVIRITINIRSSEYNKHGLTCWETLCIWGRRSPNTTISRRLQQKPKWHPLHLRKSGCDLRMTCKFLAIVVGSMLLPDLIFSHVKHHLLCITSSFWVFLFDP